MKTIETRVINSIKWMYTVDSQTTSSRVIEDCELIGVGRKPWIELTAVVYFSDLIVPGNEIPTDAGCLVIVMTNKRDIRENIDDCVIPFKMNCGHDRSCTIITISYHYYKGERNRRM